MKRRIAACLAVLCLTLAFPLTGLAEEKEAGTNGSAAAAAAEQQSAQPQTAAEAADEAFAAYVESGLSPEEALDRIRNRIIAYALMPWRIPEVLRDDLAAWQEEIRVLRENAQKGGQALPAPMSPEEIVQAAYAAYLEAGIEPPAAFARVQERLQELIAGETDWKTIVESDLAALREAAEKRAFATPEEIVQKAFAEYVNGGMSAEEAFRYVQENLARILEEGMKGQVLQEQETEEVKP